MKQIDKIRFLEQNHWSEWFDTRREADQFVSDQHPMWCVCGKLCTGLHEKHCARFRNKVNSETVKRLKHLLKDVKVWHVGVHNTGLLWWEGYAKSEDEAYKLAEEDLKEYLDEHSSLEAYVIKRSPKT